MKRILYFLGTLIALGIIYVVILNPYLLYRFVKINKCESFSEGLAGVNKGIEGSTWLPPKWGFVNTEGDIIIDFKFDEVGFCSSGFIPVKNEGKWGMVNEKGESILPIEYDNVGNAKNLFYAALKRDSLYIFEGRKLLKQLQVEVKRNDYYKDIMKDTHEKFHFAKILSVDPHEDFNLPGFVYFTFSDVTATARFDSTFIDYLKGDREDWGAGKRLMPNSGFIENTTIVVEKGLLGMNRRRFRVFEGLALSDNGFIDELGELKIDYEIDDKSKEKLNNFTVFYSGTDEFLVRGSSEIHNKYKIYFQEGLCALPKDGKFGYIDKYGSIAIPFLFEMALPFHEGLAAVNAGAGWYFIDKAGNKITKNYDSVSSFSSGRAKVRTGNKTFFIDKNDNCALFCP